MLYLPDDPREFERLSGTLEGDGWVFPEIGLGLTAHPRHLVDEAAQALVKIWSMTRGGLGGPGPLPAAGGALDQPAALIAALDHLSGLYEALKPKKERR